MYIYNIPHFYTIWKILKTLILGRSIVVLSRFPWPSLIYDFPQPVVQNWPNSCFVVYKKWLRMSRCAETSIQENFGLGFLKSRN